MQPTSPETFCLAVESAIPVFEEHGYAGDSYNMALAYAAGRFGFAISRLPALDAWCNTHLGRS